MLQQLVHETKASFAFVERNINLTKRYLAWEVVWVVYSIVNALSITYIGAGMEAISGKSMDTSFLIMYLLIGTLVWHYLSVVFDQVSEAIAWERWEGTIEYTFMAPITRLTHLVGQTLFSLVFGLLHTAIILLVVTIFFQLDLSNANFVSAVSLMVAGSLSFIGMGIIAAVLPLLSPERGAQMTHVFQALILLVSGVYYPVEVLPQWMQPIARICPATYVLRGMRASLLDGASLWDLGHIIVPLLLIGLMLIPLGMLIFNRAERYAKRTGKLKRNG